MDGGTDAAGGVRVGLPPLPRTRTGRTRRAAVAQLSALAAAGTLAAGCGIGGHPAPRAGGELRGQITLYGWDQEPISGTRRRAFDGFRARHPQLTVEQVTTGAAGNVYFEKIQSLIAGDAAPDMFIIRDSDLPYFLTRKLAMNLDPLVKRDKYDLSDFPKGAIETYRYQGGLYGLPDNITSNGFFVNVELFERAGLAPPPVQPSEKTWTFEAFRDQVQQLVNRTRSDPPTFGVLPVYGVNGMLAWVRSNGGDLLTKDALGTALDSAGAIEAMQLLADLRHRYRVAPTPQDLQGTNAQALFEAGRLAIWEGCVCQVGRFRQNAQFRWDAAFRPAGKAGLVDHLFAYPQLLYAGSRNPDAAWEALIWFVDEGMKLLTAEGALQGPKMNAHQRALFVDPTKPPRNAGLWVTSVEKYGRTPPSTTNWNEVETALNAALTPLWDGQRTAQDAAQAVKQTVDPLLRAGKWG
jgi:multiple sugar transport system substrate-binding protein